MPTSEQKAYIAGLFDGEGSVGLFFNNRSTYYIKAQMGQNNEEVLLFVHSLYPGVWTVRHNRSGDFHTIVWNGQKCEQLLTDMLPYLIVKREVVELALTFFYIPHSERVELFTAVRAINARRGRSADEFFAAKDERDKKR